MIKKYRYIFGHKDLSFVFTGIKYIKHARHFLTELISFFQHTTLFRSQVIYIAAVLFQEHLCGLPARTAPTTNNNNINQYDFVHQRRSVCDKRSSKRKYCFSIVIACRVKNTSPSPTDESQNLTDIGDVLVCRPTANCPLKCPT